MPNDHVLAPLVKTNDAALTFDAARAEALHVDGAYAEATYLWQSLWARGYRTGEVALKTSLSLVAMGAATDAIPWRDRASAAGISAAEIAFISAQADILEGQPGAAYLRLALADRSDPAWAEAFNLIAVLETNLGRHCQAQAAVEAALELDGDNGLALCNAVALGLRRGRSFETLRRAAILTVHRTEPLALAARRTQNRAAQRTLEAAADARRLPSPLDSATPDECLIEADASVRIEGLTMRADIRIEAPADALPSGLVAHSCVTMMSEDGPALKPTGRIQNGQKCWAVPAKAWKIDSIRARAILRLRLESPISGCAQINRGVVLFYSGWLPAGEGAPLRYRSLTVAGDANGAIVALDASGRRSPELAIPKANNSVTLQGVRAVGAGTRAERVRALAALYAMISIWSQLLDDTARDPVTLVVVDRGHSTVCCVRGRMIQATTHVIGDPQHLPILAHEVGHLWWGAGTVFAAGSEWLAEALAEYGLHLAEDAGLIHGYRRNAKEAVFRLLEDPDLPSNLLTLQGRSGRREAYLLRVIGGFVIAALSETLGAQPFQAWLRLLAQADRQIDAYGAIALASRLYGFSLNAFMRQWIVAPSLPKLAVTAALHRCESGYRLRLDLTLNGATLPCVGFPLTIETAIGETISVAADLCLAEQTLERVLVARPVRVTADPEHRWLIACGTTEITLTKEDKADVAV